MRISSGTSSCAAVASTVLRCSSSGRWSLTSVAGRCLSSSTLLPRRPRFTKRVSSKDRWSVSSTVRPPRPAGGCSRRAAPGPRRPRPPAPVRAGPARRRNPSSSGPKACSMTFRQTSSTARSTGSASPRPSRWAICFTNSITGGKNPASAEIVRRAIGSSGVAFISVINNPSSRRPSYQELILSGLVGVDQTGGTHVHRADKLKSSSLY